MWRAADHLARARTELLEGDGDDRERLAAAAEAFALAVAARPAWPARTQDAVGRLRRALLSGRSVDEAVARLGDDSLREVSDELWRLCDEFAEPYEFAGSDGPALALA